LLHLLIALFARPGVESARCKSRQIERLLTERAGLLNQAAQQLKLT